MVLEKRTRDYLIEDIRSRLSQTYYRSVKYKYLLDLLDELVKAGDLATVDIKNLSFTEE